MKTVLTLLVDKSMFAIGTNEYLKTGKLASKQDIDRWSDKEIEIQNITSHSILEIQSNDQAPIYIQTHPKKGGHIQTKISVWMYYKTEVEIY